KAEPLLPVDAVYFVDDTVDVVIELGASFLDLAMESDQLVGRAAEPGQRIGLEAAGLEPFDHAGLGVCRHFAYFAPGIGEEAERTRRRDLGILLAQRARRGVARVGANLAAGRLLPLVQFEKGVL